MAFTALFRAVVEPRQTCMETLHSTSISTGEVLGVGKGAAKEVPLPKATQARRTLCGRSSLHISRLSAVEKQRAAGAGMRASESLLSLLLRAPLQEQPPASIRGGSARAVSNLSTRWRGRERRAKAEKQISVWKISSLALGLLQTSTSPMTKVMTPWAGAGGRMRGRQMGTWEGSAVVARGLEAPWMTSTGFRSSLLRLIL